METEKTERKGFLKQLKENVDDHDEQMQILGAMVRLGVVIWSGFIITLNYVELPMVKKPLGASSDITFVASIFTGALATFGLSTGNGKKNGNNTTNNTNNKTKSMKKLILLLALLSPSIAKANQVTPAFTTGNMTSTTVTTQTVKEVTKKEIYGAAVKTWSGTNVTAVSSTPLTLPTICSV